MRALSAQFGVAAVLAGATACGGSGARAAEFVLSDSAGVTIANNAGALDSAPQWQLSARPALSIGSAEGELPYQLFRVRGVAQLSDGRIAVLNGGTHEIRFFERDGRFVRSVGRKGQGPGEFIQPVAMFVTRGDTVVVWDRTNVRVTVIAPDARVARTANVDVHESNPEVIGRFTDGTLLVQDERFSIPSTGFAPIPAILNRHSATGAFVDSIGAHLRFHIGASAGGQRIGRPLFDVFATVAVGADGYWVGTAERYEVIERAPSGATRRVIRWSGPDRHVTADDIRVANELELADLDDAHRAEEMRMRAGRPAADAFPAYEEIAASRSGELLVHEFERPRDTGPTHWLVFDKLGRLTARVALPRDFTPRDWGRDYVLGTTTTDVERVQRYNIERKP